MDSYYVVEERISGTNQWQSISLPISRLFTAKVYMLRLIDEGIRSDIRLVEVHIKFSED